MSYYIHNYVTVSPSSQSTGWTALMFAVNEGHKDIVQRLVSAGADVHIKDKVCGVIECVQYCKQGNNCVTYIKNARFFSQTHNN